MNTLPTVPGPIQFHFDFISPYAYLASRLIEDIAVRHGRVVDWHPMLLGISVVKVMGIKPLMETPLKGEYLRRDVPRRARKLGVPLGRSMDGPIPTPLPAARAFCWLKQQYPHLQSATAHAIYHAWWARGVSLSTPEELAARVGFPPEVDVEALLVALKGPEPARLLRDSVQASLDAGVFGAPTIIVDGEPFWGSDRLDDVEAWLSTGGW